MQHLHDAFDFAALAFPFDDGLGSGALDRSMEMMVGLREAGLLSTQR